jgi:hypothetical protein
VQPSEELKKELREHVAGEIGALARPDTIRFTEALPKTRSGKIMRRLLRDIAAGRATAQDTTTLDTIRLPGPDGRLGTSDDVTVPLVNYQRQIVISNLTNADGSTNPDIRSIAVTVRIASPGRPTRDFVVTGYISRYQ